MSRPAEEEAALVRKGREAQVAAEAKVQQLTKQLAEVQSAASAPPAGQQRQQSLAYCVTAKNGVPVYPNISFDECRLPGWSPWWNDISWASML